MRALNLRTEQDGRKHGVRRPYGMRNIARPGRLRKRATSRADGDTAATPACRKAARPLPERTDPGPGLQTRRGFSSGASASGPGATRRRVAPDTGRRDASRAANAYMALSISMSSLESSLSRSSMISSRS